MTRNDEIAALYDAACAEWTDVHVEPSTFVAYVAERVPEGTDLARIRTGLLYLACACVRGDAAAIKAFERTCAPVIAATLAQLRGLGADRDDVAQLVRQKVLV